MPPIFGEQRSDGRKRTYELDDGVVDHPGFFCDCHRTVFLEFVAQPAVEPNRHRSRIEKRNGEVAQNEERALDRTAGGKNETDEP